jgi:hypothetical protein
MGAKPQHWAEKVWRWSFPALLVLFAVLLVAKLVGLIDWSWWIVFTPLLPFALLFAFVVVCIFALAIFYTATGTPPAGETQTGPAAPPGPQSPPADVSPPKKPAMSGVFRAAGVLSSFLAFMLFTVPRWGGYELPPWYPYVAAAVAATPLVPAAVYEFVRYRRERKK